MIRAARGLTREVEMSISSRLLTRFGLGRLPPSLLLFWPNNTNNMGQGTVAGQGLLLGGCWFK